MLGYGCNRITIVTHVGIWCEYVGWDMDVTGSRSLPMAEFGINTVEPWGYATYQ